jgi:site-specific recombinase XerC
LRRPKKLTLALRAPCPRAAINALPYRLGDRAGMAFPIHPHMLRHGCAMHWRTLATTRGPSKPEGHKNIHHTAQYTELAPDRFKDFWRD